MKETRKRSARPPGPVTSDYLFRAAVHYLERYASSTQNLRRVLERKIVRRASARGESPAAFAPLLEEAMSRVGDLGLLDDAAFAQARLRSLRRRGTSARMVAGKLAEKGVPREIVERLVAEDATDEDAAARRYAERRRLGPFSTRERAARRDRDLAAMVRAGFSFTQATSVIDADIEDDESIASDPPRL